MTDHAFQLAALKELSRDLREATEGNQNLSKRVLLATGWAIEKRYVGRHFDLSTFCISVWREPGTQLGYLAPPDPSRNIKDAAEGMPQGWRLDMLGIDYDQPDEPPFFCQILDEDGPCDFVTGLGNTEALARCDALVQAKIAELSI